MRRHRSYQLQQLQERTLMSRRYMRTFMRFADVWGMSSQEVSQLLGLTGLHTMAGWKSSWQDLVLTEPQLEKVSYLLAINKLLMNRYDSDQVLQKWLRTKNDYPLFLDKTPLECFIDSGAHQLSAISEWMLEKWG